MVIAPLVRPDPPIPATARPKINMVDERAVPQRTEPISNNPRKARKVDFRVNRVYSLPAKGWRAQLERVVESIETRLEKRKRAWVEKSITLIEDTHFRTIRHRPVNEAGR